MNLAKSFLIVLVLINFSLASDKILASCSNNKSELYDLKKKSSKGYEKDSMTMDLIIRGEKVYAKSNTSESELIYINGVNPQFIEKVASGHSVLYTYFEKQKILTIQKSYDFFGPIMVNMYLECK